MGYAEVCVNAPAAQMRTFSYSVPPYLNLQPGQAVWVPFGQKLLQGIIIELTDKPAVEQTRDISDVIDTHPLLSPQQLSLARWISDYYLCPLFDAIALMLPPGFERRVLTYFKIANQATDATRLNEIQQQILTLISEKTRLGLKELEKSFGKKKAQSNVTSLAKMGLVERQYELEPVKIKTRQLPYLKLIITPAQAVEIDNQISNRRATKQLTLLRYLAEQTAPISLTEAKTKTGCDSGTVNALIIKGLITIEQVTSRREPMELQNVQQTLPLNLSPAQQSVFEPILENIKNARNKGKVFLLHGVTGSGKTEIYLQALAETVKAGKRGIVLVPEIAMTPQTIERFVSRFTNRVAILHSKLTPGEQYDEWYRIKNGEVDVVIGPRSALFAPQPEIGLIVMDEEHEWTYKQHEQSPRYHTRNVAIKLSEMIGCTVILGSATPDIETFYRTQIGNIQLLDLPERVVPVVNSPLPEVEIVDMREELKENNRSIFSRALFSDIDSALTKHQQIILFLNRRGMSSFVQCRNCGFTIMCRRCDAPMTYHLDSESLLCHRCNYRMPVPQICPRCSSRRIKFLGIGTEKLEQEVRIAFPQARVLRWDSDVTKGRYAHQKILDKFRNYEADILIGTQMVAKGLDLPLVTLVGVVNADISLNIPDFRAGERTFQLLSQVAGRAGRGQSAGRVIIQTYAPEHYAIQAAAQHNYRLFYSQEIEFRRQLREPPFTQLANLIFTHTNEKHCEEEARKMAENIITQRDARGITGLELIGPAPAYTSRLRGRYRWQIILRGHNLSEFLRRLDFGQGWTIDVDPVGI